VFLIALYKNLFINEHLLYFVFVMPIFCHQIADMGVQLRMRLNPWKMSKTLRRWCKMEETTFIIS